MPRKTKIIKLSQVIKSIKKTVSQSTQLTYLEKEMKTIIQSIENNLDKGSSRSETNL